eukprot:COSAG01_NODE_7578_length_3140_cov_40.993752_5_plen_190_part_00
MRYIVLTTYTTWSTALYGLELRILVFLGDSSTDICITTLARILQVLDLARSSMYSTRTDLLAVTSFLCWILRVINRNSTTVDQELDRRRVFGSTDSTTRPSSHHRGAAKAEAKANKHLPTAGVRLMQQQNPAALGRLNAVLAPRRTQPRPHVVAGGGAAPGGVCHVRAQHGRSLQACAGMPRQDVGSES